MMDWATLPIDMLVLIVERIDFFEDFIKFSAICKSWQLVTSIKKLQTLPPRCPYAMLTDTAEKNFPKLTKDIHPHDMLVEEVKKHKYIEGMHKRRFHSFSTSKSYEIELPEATLRKCLGVCHGWLLTIGYDLQINLLHPFTRQQIGMPSLLSFKNQYTYDDDYKPEEVVSFFVKKAVMSSNPHDNINQDCVILAIYGERNVLAFARPGDEVWTDAYVTSENYEDVTSGNYEDVIYGNYEDVIYYKGKFYAVDYEGVVFVCDIDTENYPKVTAIACTPGGYQGGSQRYLVESSGSLLAVIRFRLIDDEEDTDDRKVLTDDEKEIDTSDEEDVYEPNESFRCDPYCTKGFSIFRLEECHDDKSIHNYPFRLTKVDCLGDQTLFLGYNASVSLPSSKCIKANCIYYSEDDSERYVSTPYGGGNDTGIFDVESNSITPHYAAEFRSHLSPPIWFI